MTDTDVIKKPGQPPPSDGVSPKTWIGLTRISHKSTGSVVGKVGKVGKVGLPYLPHPPHLLCLLVRNPGLMGAMLGAFMAVLDIQITNSSLQEIQAALGATLEEGSWISTAETGKNKDARVMLRILTNCCSMPSTSVNRRHLARWDEVLAPYSLGYRIKLLSQLLGRIFQERLEPYGLTSFHWVVLCCLWEEDGLATSSIGERLQQVGGTLTGVLDRMEERGLVRRERDSRDRRVWRIWLTESGKQLETVLPPIAVEIREEAMAGMPTAERELFSKLIDQAIANLS